MAALTLLTLAATGCASDPPPPARAPLHQRADGRPERVKLAVLPVESDQFPRVAGVLNEVLRDVHVKGIDDYFMSKASLEVVQLSIECVEQTNGCYSAVGRSLTAQRLLLAQIAPSGTRKRDKGLRVTVTYFDVDGGAAQNVADKTFPNEPDAIGGMPDLVAQAINGAAPSVRAAK